MNRKTIQISTMLLCVCAILLAGATTVSAAGTTPKGIGTLENYISNEAIFVGYIEADAIKASAF
ncbi:MAG: hypothetical protein HN909_06700, partial [Phycisphaerales bacterium]|nr:hypothetical protein [Phycisphaerales bacterium]